MEDVAVDFVKFMLQIHLWPSSRLFTPTLANLPVERETFAVKMQTLPGQYVRTNPKSLPA
jgi:hypothetical protein